MQGSFGGFAQGKPAAADRTGGRRARPGRLRPPPCVPRSDPL